MAAAAAGPAVAAAAGAVQKTPRPPKPQKGDWRARSQEGGKGGGKGSTLFKGDAGRARKMMIGEFIICIVLLGLSPLAAEKDMGPIRFMKRGSATCAMFIVLGLVSALGKGAARASAMFGALVTLVLLVDQRGAFGKLAATLNRSKDDDARDAAFLEDGAGPDDSTATDEEPGVAAT